MRTSPVIPVLVIDDAATARPLAEALVAGGLRVLEVTMRTPAALEAIAEMKKVDGAIVGAGTVVNTDQLRQVADAGIERSEEHTSELQSLMRISYAVFCLKQKN